MSPADGGLLGSGRGRCVRGDFGRAPGGGAVLRAAAGRAALDVVSRGAPEHSAVQTTSRSRDAANAFAPRGEFRGARHPLHDDHSQRRSSALRDGSRWGGD